MDERERELYEALRGAGDPQALVALVQREPEMLSAAFLSQVDDWVAQAEAEGNDHAVLGLRQRRAVLVELQQRRAREAELPPLSRALMAFIRAEDDVAARQVFDDNRAMLDTEGAQQAIESAFKSDDAGGRARIAERCRLLQRLREQRAGE